MTGLEKGTRASVAATGAAKFEEVSRRIAEVEAENEALRKQLRVVAAALQEAEARAGRCGVLEAKLKLAETENEVLRAKLQGPGSVESHGKAVSAEEEDEEEEEEEEKETPEPPPPAATNAAVAGKSKAAKAAAVRLAVARECKERADEAFRDSALVDATVMYHKGIHSIQPLLEVVAETAAADGDEAAALQEAAELLVALQLALAEVCLKKDDFWGALEAAGTVLERQRSNPLALYRRGLALTRLGEKESAAGDFEEVLEQDPKNSEALRELRLIKGEEYVRALLRGVGPASGPLAKEEPAQPDAESLTTATDLPGAEDTDGSVGLASRQHSQLSGDVAASSSLGRGPQEATAPGAESSASAAPSEGGGSSSSSGSEACPAEAELGAEPQPPALPTPPPSAADATAHEDSDKCGATEEHKRGNGFANKGERAAGPDHEADPDMNLSMIELIKHCTRGAHALKEAGNDSMKLGNPEKAATQYAHALAQMEVIGISEAVEQLGLPCIRTHPDLEALNEAVELMSLIYLNLAQANLKREDFDGAIDAATSVLHWKPQEAKALYRRGIAHLRMGSKEEAFVDFQALLAVEPTMGAALRAELLRSCRVSSAAKTLDPVWHPLFESSSSASPGASPTRGPASSSASGAKDEDDEDDEDDDEDAEASSPDARRQGIDDDERAGENVAVSSDDEVEVVDDERDAEEAAAEASTSAFGASAADDGGAAEGMNAKSVAVLMVLEQIRADAQEMKDAGTRHFQQGSLEDAAWCYSQGASRAAQGLEVYNHGSSLLWVGPGGPKALKDDLEQVQVSCHLNLALCHLKLGEPEPAEKAADEALRLQPDSVKGLFRRAQANLARARAAVAKHGEDPASPAVLELEARAKADLKAVLTIEPQNVEARRELASLLGGEYGNATKAGEAPKASPAPARGSNAPAAAPTSPPKPGAAQNPFAGMFGDQKALKERCKAARVQRQAEELERLREAGNSAHRDGDYAAAQEHYTAALALDPTATALLLNRAATRLMLEEFRSGLADCLKAAELQPSLAKAYLRGAKCMQQLGDFPGADALLAKGLGLVSAADRSELESQRQGMQMLLRLISEAEAALTPQLEGQVEGQRALRLVQELQRRQAPQPAVRPLLLRALLQSREPGRAREAERLSSEQLRASSSLEVWYWRALALLMVGERAQAKSALNEAVSRQNTDSVERPVLPYVEALKSRLERADSAKDKGNQLFSSRRWEDAAEQYEEAIRAAAGDTEMLSVLHTNISAALRKVEQRSEEAFRHATKAIEANPSYAKAFFRRGVLHYDAGRWEQSFEDFRRASQLEPGLQGLDQWLRRGRHAAREGRDRKNHYRELGLHCDCEQEDVKKKFRQLARECHPDKVRDASPAERTAAETRFKAVNEAHEVLSSVTSRREYDFGKDNDHERLGWGFPQRSQPRGHTGWGRGGHPSGRGGFGGGGHYGGGFGNFHSGFDSDEEGW